MRSNEQPINRRPLDLADSRDLINFYSNPQQRRRGIAALNIPMTPAGLVLAAPRADLGFFSQELRDGGVSVLDLNVVEITPDWHRCIARMLDACLHAQQRHAAVRLLADFGGDVHYGAIFQLESLLRSASREWKLRCFTQYDARAFSEAIDVDALSRFGTVLFGDYYRNQDGPARERRENNADETVSLSSGDD
jgi:hypothetical protein